MPKFGNTPPEPPAIKALDDCAPKFAAALARVFARLTAQGWRPVVRESLRTAERQTWLYGIGRDYDPDGRGIVTNAETAEHGRHIAGLAADCVDARYGDNAPAQFWEDLAAAAEAEGLTAGYRWKRKDGPHVQWTCPTVSPTDDEIALRQSQGNAALWEKLGAA